MWLRPIATDMTIDMDARIERMVDVLADAGDLEGAPRTIRRALELSDSSPKRLSLRAYAV